MICRLLGAVLCLLLAAVPAAAKDYTASRFDARIEVLRGGALRVTETIVFTFTDGTFRQVFRTIPTRRTDGVEFVGAAMDGRDLPQGDGPGQVEVRHRNGLRVEWNFSPVSGGSHTFQLTYLARGVVRHADDADLLEWRALPSEHDYRIGASTVDVTLPALPLRAPQLDTRRIDGRAGLRSGERTVSVDATSIRRNGSFTVSIPFPRGSVLDGPPAWQAREIAQRKTMPVWLGSSAAVVLAGLTLLFGLRQSYDAPPRTPAVAWPSVIPPDSSAPAIAGALASNGQARFEHAMGALFGLAERGVVLIREDPRGRFGQRSFTIERTRSTPPVAPHEEALLEIIFAGRPSAGATVPLVKARSQFMRRMSRFKLDVRRELTEAHLIDPGRLASRRTHARMGSGLLVLAAVAVVPCILLVDRSGGWPFLVPLALTAVALVSFAVMSSLTPLSNEGVRRAAQWRAYRKHLSDPQGVESRWGAGGTAEARILPFAVAFGLSAAWSKFMKKRHAETPSWFQAAQGMEAGPAFAAFVATGGTGAQSGGGAGGGGAAGGGASGAH